MHIARFALLFAAAGAFCFALAGCSSTTRVTVPVPPRVDLAQFQTIGLVSFTSNQPDAQLRAECTRQFLQAMHEAQPGVRVVELGEDDRVLKSINRNSWDNRAFLAVSKKHNVDVVILGRFDVQQTKPDVRFSTEWKSLSVKSDVDGSLSARIVETNSGATVWSDSARMTTTVASGSINSRGEGGFGTTDVDAAYGNMVGRLVFEITDDFRTHYVTKRVPKDQVQTASAGTY